MVGRLTRGFTLLEVLAAALVAGLVMAMMGQTLQLARPHLLAQEANQAAQNRAKTVAMQLRAGLSGSLEPGHWQCLGALSVAGWRHQQGAGWLASQGQPNLLDLMPRPMTGNDVLLVWPSAQPPDCRPADSPAVAYFVARNAGGEPALFRRQVLPERSARVELSAGLSEFRLRFGWLTAGAGMAWGPADALPPAQRPELVEVRFATAETGARPYRLTLVPGQFARVNKP